MSTHYISGRSPAHSALVWGRAVATCLKLSPAQRGKLLSLLTADQLPPGLHKETVGGHLSFAVETDLFSRTLRREFGAFASSAAVNQMVKRLEPEVPTLFPLASNTHLFLPDTASFQPYLLGAQPDIVKVFPSALWKNLAGICSCGTSFVGRLEASFPIFKNLASIVFGKKPVTFIGTASEIKRIQEIVDLELFGLSSQTVAEVLSSLPGYAGESASQLAREQAYLGIRPGFKPWDNGATPLLPLSAYLRLMTFEETTDPSILRTGSHTFQVKDRFGEYPVDLIDASPRAVIAMPGDKLPEDPLTGIPDNAVYMVSTGNGMVESITVCFIIKVNGKSILVETPAYANQYLAELGIKLADLDCVYISHSHHDHDSTAMLLSEFRRDKPSLIMSPLTALASSTKAARLLGHVTPVEVFSSLCYSQLYPGKPLILGEGNKKVKLEVMDGFHSVLSTMLAVYTSSDGGATWEKAVVYTGDTLGPRGLELAVKAGVLTPERRDAILNFVKDAKVVVIDVGSNIIHPDADEVIKEWQPYVTAGIIKLIHNVLEDVQKGKIKKAALSALAKNQEAAWKALIDKGYLVEVMGSGILTPAFYGERKDFDLSQTPARDLEEQLFKALEAARNVALEAAGKMGVSGEIISINSLDSSVATISEVPLMQGLTPSTVLKLARGAVIQWHKRGETLVEEGDTGNDRFFIIKKGSVEVSITDSGGQEKNIILGPGQTFGERRVLLGVPANAAVRTLSGCELLVLTKQQYESLSDVERSRILGNLIKTEQLRPIIGKAFPGASPAIINLLISAAREQQYNFGDKIITEGSTDLDALYIIADGEISIWQTKEGEKVKVAERKPFEIIGEFGVVNQSPRNADCVVESFMAKVLVISASVIDDLRNTFPFIDLSLKQLMEQRRRGF